MPKYLFKANLSSEGAAGVLAEGGTVRESDVAKAVESLGGTLESFYFAFGGTDVFAIAEMPDNESAAAMALAVSASGRVSTETVVLITPAEMDRAQGKTTEYRPPGG